MATRAQLPQLSIALVDDACLSDLLARFSRIFFPPAKFRKNFVIGTYVIRCFRYSMNLMQRHVRVSRPHGAATWLITTLCTSWVGSTIQLQQHVMATDVSEPVVLFLQSRNTRSSDVAERLRDASCH